MSIEARLRAAAQSDLITITAVVQPSGQWRAHAVRMGGGDALRTDFDPAVALNDVLARWHDGESACDPLGENAVVRSQFTAALRRLKACIPSTD
jgi:hypothetical protein